MSFDPVQDVRRANLAKVLRGGAVTGNGWTASEYVERYVAFVLLKPGTHGMVFTSDLQADLLPEFDRVMLDHDAFSYEIFDLESGALVRGSYTLSPLLHTTSIEKMLRFAIPSNTIH